MGSFAREGICTFIAAGTKNFTLGVTLELVEVLHDMGRDPLHDYLRASSASSPEDSGPKVGVGDMTTTGALGPDSQDGEVVRDISKPTCGSQDGL